MRAIASAVTSSSVCLRARSGAPSLCHGGQRRTRTKPSLRDGWIVHCYYALFKVVQSKPWEQGGPPRHLQTPVSWIRLTFWPLNEEGGGSKELRGTEELQGSVWVS